MFFSFKLIHSSLTLQLRSHCLKVSLTNILTKADQFSFLENSLRGFLKLFS